MSATKQPVGPDVRLLNSGELAEMAFPGGKSQAFRIYFEPRVHDDVWRHATESMAVEICGVLVGKWARDANGPFVLVSESIRGEAAASKFAEVTFTHETWAKINQQMDTRFAALAIVGWYHSHPDFGVFLSDRDRFIQEHFFSGPGQVAHVVDPVRKTEGAFVWRDGKPTLAAHFWVGDHVQVGTPAGEESAMPAESAPGQGAVASLPVVAAKSGRIDWVGLAGQMALYAMLFLVGFLLAGKLSDVERVRIEHDALVRGFLAQRGPGLREELDQVLVEMMSNAQNSKALAEQHAKLASETPEIKDQWQQVLSRMERSMRLLARIQAVYSLTPSELAVLKAEINQKAKVGADATNKDKDGKPPEKKDEKTTEKKD